MRHGRRDMLRDRTDAGDRLAERLSEYRATDAVVLALPRGGVPVAARIARRLELPLDLIVVRKVGAPGNPELALGAVAWRDGTEELVVNNHVAEACGLRRKDIEALAAPERREAERRHRAYGARDLPLEGRIAILVDDGIATGATMRAAIRAVRRQKPALLVLAIPVAASDALEALRPEADRTVCPLVPPWFAAVGAHYMDFPQVSDAEVVRLMQDGDRT